MKLFVPLYVPVGVPFGTPNPQKIVLETFVVEVGDVRVYPVTVTLADVSAVAVPGYVKLEDAYDCELVAIEFAPDTSVDCAAN